MKRATAWCDGRGNAGTQGACATVLAIEEREALREVERAIKLPGEPTNNDAEYEAILLTMQLALERGVTHLTIHSDSQLVVNQLMGRFKINHESLRTYRDRCVEMGQNFTQVGVIWVPRSDTKRPDKLCRDLFAPVKPPARRSRPAPIADKPNPFLPQKT